MEERRRDPAARESAAAHAADHRVTAAHDDHGHSVAAWTTVGIIMVGTVVSAVAFPLKSFTVFWVGVAVAVLGVVVGYVWSRSDETAAVPSYTRTAPLGSDVEGPTRGSAGTNRP